MPFAFSGAVIITPKPTAEVHIDSGATLSNTTTKLNWTPITNATDYVIEVATSQTALNQQPDIARHFAQSDTTALIKHVPLNGTQVYIRIWAKINGEWQYQDYELGTQPKTNKKTQVTRTYFIADHLGTPRFGFNDKKIQTWRWASDGFGNQAPNTDVDGDGKQVHFNFRMPGQYYDAESGLFYNWNRYYDAGMGRYVTSDPIGLDGGMNTYGYVGGNPVVYFDDNGLSKSQRGGGKRNARIDRRAAKLRSQIQGLRDLMRNSEARMQERLDRGRKRAEDVGDAAQLLKQIKDLEDRLRRLDNYIPTKCVEWSCPWDQNEPQKICPENEPLVSASPIRGVSSGCTCSKEVFAGGP